MAKFKNVFSEASKRLKDFKARGFIPEGSKYAYQDFVNEVVAENRGESYKGAYTASAYESAYGVEVDYYSSETFDEIQSKRLDNLVVKYKQKIKNIYEINDFYDLSSRYGQDDGFDPRTLDMCDSLDDLIDHANSARNVQTFLFRNKNGRNRRDESSQMEIYANQFFDELTGVIADMTAEKIQFLF